ncbi:hypothetical protein FQN50_008375 [Emmonsiellopsis sp. PD_5]|nr:hypothetical protein FQN50_008375 [Emmonsiellopsis sp. PD_5]
MTPSPSTSFSSDKENRDSSRTDKRKTAPPSTQSAEASPTMADASNKRRRLSDKGLSDRQSQAAHRRRLQQVNNTDLYDPDQDPEERRAVRKGLRDLAMNLNDSRAEYLQPGHTGIRTTLESANKLFKSVKQTSDATIDSRLLVSAADLTYKRTAQAVLGDGQTGIDVDDFVSKCIGYMRQGPRSEEIPFSSTQRRRRRATGQDVDEESGDEGDALNWDWLGRRACFRHNLRPAVCGFLLGPLSVQKKARQLTQRRARQAPMDPSRAVQPQELKQSDLEAQREASNLTDMCTSIRQMLDATQKQGEALATEELSSLGEDIPEDEVMEIMNKHSIADDGGVPLFRFCINPNSFGQTVENLFYVSFLIRDGSVGISTDGNGLPTLHPSTPAAPSEAQAQKLQKHQTVFSLDFETWEDLIEVFDIQRPIIPHRREIQKPQAANGGTAHGWYA